MKKTLIIICSIIALLAIYKKQHIQPVDDPKDSPIFPQRLKSSLDRFQANEFPARQGRRDVPAGKRSPSPRSSVQRSKDLVASGRCGRVTLTWVADEKLDKNSVRVMRRKDAEKYVLLKTGQVLERAEGGGTRYWISDSGLGDGAEYEYLISYKGPAAGKETRKGPVSINLVCSAKDREMLAQRAKKIKEYYSKQGLDTDAAAGSASTARRSTLQTKDLVATGRCGSATLTWVTDQKMDKDSIKLKRKTGKDNYVLLSSAKVYERAEGQGVRYWLSDSGLKEGVQYEYLISFKGTGGKEIVKGPLSINMTCNERDREMLARRDKRLKEYYQKRGGAAGVNVAAKPYAYQLSKETYQVEPGNSPRKGRSETPVTLVVFTDFECVHCSTWARTLDTIVNTFPADVEVVFKNYPIAYHKQAELAAMAALAGGDQGKFWEMHDMLFQNQKALSRQDILGYAGKLGLDLPKFITALDKKELREIINQDKAQGTILGVKNTPTTFINGRRLLGSPPVAYIKGVIEKILNDKGTD